MVHSLRSGPLTERTEITTILKQDSAEIDVGKPLGAQGADELDVVAIVMVVEEAFKVEIPNSAIGQTVRSTAGYDVGERNKTLTVQKLAEVVTRQLTK